jgi:hypothetical protein
MQVFRLSGQSTDMAVHPATKLSSSGTHIQTSTWPASTRNKQRPSQKSHCPRALVFSIENPKNHPSVLRATTRSRIAKLRNIGKPYMRMRSMNVGTSTILM